MDPLLAGTDPEPIITFEPAQTTEPVAAQFPEAGATIGAIGEIGAIGAVEPAPLPSSDDTQNWAMAPAEPWEVDDPPESLSDPRPASTGEDGQEKPKRSLVFKAIVVLAVLFLVAAAAVGSARALHHPATTAAPPAHVTTPTQAAEGPALRERVRRGRPRPGRPGSGGHRRRRLRHDRRQRGPHVALGIPHADQRRTVINPYISSLQLYGTFLSGTKVRPPPRLRRPAPRRKSGRNCGSSRPSTGFRRSNLAPSWCSSTPTPPSGRQPSAPSTGPPNSRLLTPSRGIGLGTFQLVCRPPYRGIPTADTTTPLSDDNAAEPTRTRRKEKSTAAPESEGATSRETARRPAKKSVSATRSSKPKAAQPDAPGPRRATHRPARMPTSATPALHVQTGVPPKPVWAPEPIVTPRWPSCRSQQTKPSRRRSRTGSLQRCLRRGPRRHGNTPTQPHVRSEPCSPLRSP